MTMRKKVIVGTLPIIVLPLLWLLSYLTTYMYWEGAWPEGEWVIRVIGEDGRAIRDAKLEAPEASPMIFYPFHNETQRSIKANDAGEITVFIQTSFFYGAGSTYRLFWIWRIDSRRRPVVKFRISASGYRSAVIDTDAVLGCENSLLVRLEKNK